ncbi:MAG: DNA polymerase, partial [Thermoguttaceae bacterium]
SRTLQIFDAPPNTGGVGYAEPKLLASHPSPLASSPSPLFHTVTRDTFAAFIAALNEQKTFSFDTETVAISPAFAATQPRYTEIVGMSFCWSNDEAWYLPLLAPLGEETLDRTTTLAALKPILENENVGKVGQNLKFDKVVLRGAEIELRGIAFDTMVADYLLNTGLRQHNLDILAETYLGHTTIKIAELIGNGKKQRTMRDVPLDVITRYAGEDAWVVWRLVPILKQRLAPLELIRNFNHGDTESTEKTNPLCDLRASVVKQTTIQSEKLAEIFEHLEMPLVNVLAEMEWNGITVDVDSLRELSHRFAEKLENLEREAFAIAGHEFNLASPKQLATVLFDELHLPVVKKTKTGASTDVEVLDELATIHPLPATIVAHRQISKLKGTYADALVTQIHPQTGRIHASFNQVVTATGRLSSSDPNLQNIPTRTEEGRAIRAAFRPGRGFDLLLACDYSQIELRVLAHFSEDERLCRVLTSGADIHTTVAAEIFGVAADDVTSDMRRQAKAVNFGIIYGQTAFGLSKQLGIPRGDAERFIGAYLANYPGVVAWMDATLDRCATELTVVTLDGRERRITGVRPRERRRGDLSAPERMAVNTVIQGSAADLMKRAMVAIDRCLPATNLRAAMLLQIHDELVFEVTRDDLVPLTELVIEAMSLGQPLRVPLVIDTESETVWK